MVTSSTLAVEYNEDLSAFHGPTIDTEVAYASRAVDYILSLYAPGTPIIVMGHSMGGIVSTALLPNPNISAIITLSTPHTLPPVRFDRRIEHIYANNHRLLASNPTPILSLCGGATDLMIPSESCMLSSAVLDYPASIYRRTVFTTALEGCWTGVGHLAIMWCHQVRWRIARAALEIAASKTLEARATAMDKWLRDGLDVPPPPQLPLEALPTHGDAFYSVPPNQHLLVREPSGSASYLVPTPSAPENQASTVFVLYVSQGSVPPISPQRPLPFRTTIRLCRNWGSTDVSCSALVPSTLKLIPHPIPNSPFPVPDEGVDESEGVVLFEADVPLGPKQHVVVTVEDGDKRGWVFGGFADREPLKVDVGLPSQYMPHLPRLSCLNQFSGLLVSPISIVLPNSIRTQVIFTKLLANALIAYRIRPGAAPGSTCNCESLLSRLDTSLICSCSFLANAIFPPLLTHSSHPSETHYFPLTPDFKRPVLLHSHSSAPYVASDHPAGHALVIHSSGECWINQIEISVDWWATIGRWGTRYGPAAACWAVGIMAIITFDIWKLVEGGGGLKSPGSYESTNPLTTAPIPDVKSSLEFFARKRLPLLTVLSLFISVLPLRVGLWLGNSGAPVFAPLSVFLLIIAFGLVCAMWLLLVVLLWPIRRLIKLFGRQVDCFMPCPSPLTMS